MIEGPYVIGATGGSGTRVVARVVRRCGMYIGTNLNPASDAIDFGAYSTQWIDRVAWAAPIPAHLEAELVEGLDIVLRNHLRDLPTTARAWGWKEPRSSFLLPFFHAQFSALKFLHVIRDGRDMAFSQNQNQLRMHGHTVLGEAEASWSEPLRSIALWSRHNLRVAEYGEHNLGDRYRRIRFEDLCATPIPVIREIVDFFGLDGDFGELARTEVTPPASIGRWRRYQPDDARALHDIAAAALARFGYDS